MSAFDGGATAPAAAAVAAGVAPAWLALEGVGHRYGGRQALAGLDLALAPGIVGLLGPNGAGKSTLMRLLATLVKPGEGRIRWHGTDTAADPDPLRRTLGYLPQEFGVYPALSAREFLAYLAAVKGLPRASVPARIEQCLAAVGLADDGDRALATFSGGMRQRVGIAQALLNDPRLLIVDEPTVGLDPEERLRFRALLTELAGDRLVVLSTHIVADVEASAGSLVVLDGGRLRWHGRAEDLIAAAAGQVWDWIVPAAQLPALRAKHRISAALHRADGVQLRVIGERAPSADAVPATATLEDAYLRLRAPGGG